MIAIAPHKRYYPPGFIVGSPVIIEHREANEARELLMHLSVKYELYFIISTFLYRPTFELDFESCAHNTHLLYD